MKIIMALLAAGGLALAPAVANAAVGDETFTGVDTDRNGSVSWAEFSLVFTDISETQFNTADLDKNGELSAEEFDTLALSTGSIGSKAGADLAVPTNKSLTDTSTE